MLSHECEAFRQRYERGAADPHLERCTACRRFAEFVDGLARVGFRAPLEDELRTRLREVPSHAGGAPEALPRLPELPLPAGLGVRLRAIARRQRTQTKTTTPIWIRSPRYAVAASYLLTLLIAGTVGNPAAWASQTASRFERVGMIIESVEAHGRERVGGLGERIAEGYAVGKEWMRASRSSLAERWRGLAETFDAEETTDETPAATTGGTSS